MTLRKKEEIDIYPNLHGAEREAQRKRDEELYPGFEAFWSASIRRAAILRFARTELRYSPYGLFLSAGARLLTMTTPLMVACPVSESLPMPLNPFIGIIGGSSTGKGMTMKAAEQLVPYAVGSVAQITNPSGGEAVGRRIVSVVQENDGKPRRKSNNRHVEVKYYEGLALQQMASRKGSTITSMLLQAFSNEPIGTETKKESESSQALPYTYRMGVSVAVQPENMGWFYDNETSGLAQRFLWSQAADPSWKVPDSAIESTDEVIEDLRKQGLYPLYDCDKPYPYDAGVENIDGYLNGDPTARKEYFNKLIVVRFPEEAREEAKQIRKEASQQDPYHADQVVDDMQAHKFDRQVIVATMMRLIDGPKCAPDEPIVVDDEEWETSGHVVACSDKAYEAGRRQYRVSVRQKKAEQISSDRQARNQANREMDKVRVLGGLKKAMEKTATPKGSDINRWVTGRLRGARCEELIEELESEGKIVRRLDNGSVKSSIWEISV